MLEYLSKTSTHGFCQYCPRREGPGSGAASWSSRPPPHWTRRGVLNEVVFGELRILLFVCFMIVHGWMGMDV